MTEQRVSKRYARAVFQTAKEINLLDEIRKDLVFVKNTIEDSRELENLLKSPVVHVFKKKSILEEVFKSHVSDLTMNFISLLSEKQRESLTISIIAQFMILYNKEMNIMPITVSSAVELNDEIRAKIITKLEEITNQTVLSTFLTDPDMKGGIKVRIQDWVYDASIRTRLNTLYHRLAEGIVN